MHDHRREREPAQTEDRPHKISQKVDKMLTMGQIHHTILVSTSTNLESQKEWRPRDTLFTAFAIRARRMSVLHF